MLKVLLFAQLEGSTPQNIPAGNPIEAITKHLHNAQGMTTRDLLIFAAIGAAIALLVLVLTFAGRALGWWTRHSSARLFRELCAAHELSSVHRKLLLKLARGYKMADSALIFALPERFDEATLPPQLQHRRAEIAQLRELLFETAA